jgi:maltooligosyltrehalose trehalohydrolase
MLDITWSFPAGSLRLLANFGGDPMNRNLDTPWRTIWSSPQAKLEGNSVSLPAWSGMILKDLSA